MKKLMWKLIQVPIDFLIGLAMYFATKYIYKAGDIAAVVIALIAATLFAEIVGLKAK